MNSVRVFDRLGVKPELVADYTINLDYEQRDKGRLKCVLEDQTEIRLFLERGRPLQVGEKLSAECGAVVEIAGRHEQVVVARCDDWRTFATACYHLGNRHVKVQVGALYLVIKPDHVLEEMLSLLGLSCEHTEAVFVPESGAYSGGHHHHAH